MTSSRHTRRIVLHAALEACPALPTARGRSHRLWGPLVQRMKALAKPDAAGAKRLATFGKVIGEKLDDPVRMSKALNGDWMQLLNQVLNAVASPATKQERLNCATCDPADFPALLAVILAVAHGAPGQMWRPCDEDFVGHVGVAHGEDEGCYKSSYRTRSTPESHYRIADKTWYRPQLAMLVTSLWPKNLGLEYYESTLQHILNPEEVESLASGSYMVGEAPDCGGLKIR